MEEILTQYSKKFENEYSKVLELIKKYNKICVFRHIIPDFDALGSQLGLYYFLKENFITESDLDQIIRDRIQDDKHPDLVIREREMDEETEERYDPDDWYKNMLDYYYDELIPKGFADPDLKQSDHEYVKEQFPVIGIHYFIRNNCIMLDPDIVVKGDDPSNHLFYTYGANENLI